jgi:predicted DNA-binding transcriptional regulator YafY
MMGDLANYQLRRQGEYVLYRDVDNKYVNISASEDCLFWFRQRILQYGENAQVLEPNWLAEKIIAVPVQVKYKMAGFLGWQTRI